MAKLDRSPCLRRVAAGERSAAPDWGAIRQVILRIVACRVPAHAVTDVVDEAVSNVFFRQASCADVLDYTAFAGQVARVACAGWHRRRLRGQLHQQAASCESWEAIPARQEVGSRAAWFREDFVPELRPLLTRHQNDVLSAVLREQTMKGAARMLLVAPKAVRTALAAIARKGRENSKRLPPLGQLED